MPTSDEDLPKAASGSTANPAAVSDALEGGATRS